MLNTKKTYEGFSLVEMLITTVILGFLMLTAALVLTTLIKVSTTATNKARVRSESEYILEYLRRSLRTTDPDYVVLRKTSLKTYDASTGRVEGNDSRNCSANCNEIRFRPNGSTTWICLSFFKGISTDKGNDGFEKGYILKTTASNSDNCFDNSKPYEYMVLNSRLVDIDKLNIKFRDTIEKNKVIQFDMESSAIYWYFGNGALISRNFNRTAVVKTETILW